jgi:hypothetical protein
MTDVDIAWMMEVLDEIHENKYVLLELEIFKSARRFDKIPKLHVVSHYAHFTCELGTLDGYSSEMSEHLHSVYVKPSW